MKEKEVNNTKQAAWVALGSLFSFTFGIVSSMILSRYFDKIEYGTYKQVLYVYNSLLMVFTLGLPKAYSYFLPRTPLDEAKSMISKITNLFFVLGGVLSILLFFGAGLIADFLNNRALESALKIFSPVPFFMMPTMGLEGILATYRKTKLITLYTVITRLIMLFCVALPVVFMGTSCNEALVGFVIASAFSFILALSLKYYPIRKEEHNKSTCTYKEIFNFVLPLFIASIWGILINSTDQFFISRYFGTETFAEFSNGAMELPFVSMVIGACSTVLIPLFSKKVYENADFKLSIFPIWKGAFVKSAMLIYPIIFFCFFDAEFIMQILYSDLYVNSSNYFRIKLLMYFFKIISFYSILIAIGAAKFYAKIFMYTFFVLVSIEYLAVKIVPNPYLVTLIHVLSTIVICLIFVKFIADRFNVSFISLFPIRYIMKITLLSIISLIIVSLIRTYYLSYSIIGILLLDCCIFMAIYLVGCYFIKLNYWTFIESLKK